MNRDFWIARIVSESDRPFGAETPIRTVLADDHRSIRHSLRALLDGERDIEVVAEVTELRCMIWQVCQCQTDVLIVDLQLPNSLSLSNVRELRRSAPGTQVVAITMELSQWIAARVLDAGALGYVLKEQADRDLVRAVRAATRREPFVSPEVYGTNCLSSA